MWEGEEMTLRANVEIFKREYKTVRSKTTHISLVVRREACGGVRLPVAHGDGVVCWPLEQPVRDAVGEHTGRSWQSHSNHALVTVLSCSCFNG